MSGILDSKSRILDAMLTVEGRRQMAEGTFDISYVTFTDLGVSYIKDSHEGHEDPTSKIYLEACNLPQDQITFEANDEGKLVPFRVQDIKLFSSGGDLIQGSLVNGRLTTYQYNHGRRIKVSTLSEVSSDTGRGFIYSDTTGLTASILIDSTKPPGTFTTSGPPYVAFIGTAGGIGENRFAQTISGAIESLRLVGGPSVFTNVQNNLVYFDVGQSVEGTSIISTGTLSSPLQIEEASIGGRIVSEEIENASFASQIQGILTSSFDNFLKIQSISSVDRLFEDDKFILSTNELTFDMSRINSTVIKSFKESPPLLNSIDSLFNDDKMSHLDNFMYLPPIVKTSDSLIPDKSKIENLDPYLLGDYPSWGDNEKKLTFSKIKDQLTDYEEPQVSVYFNKSSRRNRIIGQIFEVTDNTVSKLDVVDFGEIKNDVQEPTVISDRVFFAGKTFLDDRGTTCFVNMFTLIFSKDDRIERQIL
jgi:hypothetical protein